MYLLKSLTSYSLKAVTVKIYRPRICRIPTRFWFLEATQGDSDSAVIYENVFFPFLYVLAFQTFPLLLSKRFLRATTLVPSGVSPVAEKSRFS